MRDLEKLAQNLYISPPTPRSARRSRASRPRRWRSCEARRDAFRGAARLPGARAARARLRHPGDARPAASSSTPTASRFADDSRAFCRDVLEATGRRVHARASTSAPIGQRARALRLHDRRDKLEDGVERLRATCAPDIVGRFLRHNARSAYRSCEDPYARVTAPRPGRACAARRLRCSRPTTTGRARRASSTPRRARSRSTRCIGDDRRTRRSQQRLERVQEIRAFASRELGLPDNASYTRYTDLGRPFVVWNVFATPRALAQAAAVVLSGRRLRQLPRLLQRGGGARRGRAPRAPRATTSTSAACPRTRRSAGSTTRCCRRSSAGPDIELARLVFHELAHQVVYAKDDTQFNESFAVAVEEAGVRALDRGADAADRSSSIARARARRAPARRVPRARPRRRAAARGGLRERRERRRQARAQGAGVRRRCATAYERGEGRRARPRGVRPLVRGRTTAPGPTTRASCRSALYDGQGPRVPRAAGRRRAATCRASTRASRCSRRRPGRAQAMLAALAAPQPTRLAADADRSRR